MIGSRLTVRRIEALEGLRGVAAAVVVVRHTFNAIAMPLPLRHAMLEGPLAVVLNAQGAVQLFFVLSGYVLAGSLGRCTNTLDYLQFYIKRFFRIYPPFVAAVLFAWGASFAYRPPEIGLGGEFTAWLYELSGIHLSVGQLLTSLRFPGNAYNQLPVGWTLEVEMLFSLLLPLLFLIARRSHWLLLLLLSAYVLAFHETSSFSYAIDFCLGIAAYLERDRLFRWASGIPRAIAWLGVLVSLVLLAGPMVFRWSIPAYGILISGFDNRSIAVMGVGALGLILGAIYVPRLRQWLSARPVLFLGKISFSLYLLHFPVLIICAPLVKMLRSPWAEVSLIALVLGSSILLSVFFFHCVERPSILIGNRVCGLLARARGTESLVSTPPGN
jgi:peptidoglycan/LPS O-acetylase OafA/YrhL